MLKEILCIVIEKVVNTHNSLYLYSKNKYSQQGRDVEKYIFSREYTEMRHHWIDMRVSVFVYILAVVLNVLVIDSLGIDKWDKKLIQTVLLAIVSIINILLICDKMKYFIDIKEKHQKLKIIKCSLLRDITYACSIVGFIGVTVWVYSDNVYCLIVPIIVGVMDCVLIVINIENIKKKVRKLREKGLEFKDSKTAILRYEDGEYIADLSKQEVWQNFYGQVAVYNKKEGNMDRKFEYIKDGVIIDGKKLRFNEDEFDWEVVD
nr:hypothetical protein [uncultured Anaerosporobacter sp.]